jgi:hypothetical protein
MPATKPFRRTSRQFVNGSHGDSGNWMYLLHPKFARDPQHYVRAFLLLQRDLVALFDYIEPADKNLGTYSHRVHQLLMSASVEVEANLTAVLVENNYRKRSGDLSMRDYKLVDRTHHLSSFEVRSPGWRGSGGLRRPFLGWKNQPPVLAWYQAYNKSKHDRHTSFERATFEALVDAMAGLVALMAAQFHQEDYSSAAKSLSIGSNYSYDTSDGMESAMGDYFRVRFPTDWDEQDKYDFAWAQFASEADPFAEHVYVEGA